MTIINLTWRKVGVFAAVFGLLSGVGRGVAETIFDGPEGCVIERGLTEISIRCNDR
jgi:hypothetical protein